MADTSAMSAGNAVWSRDCKSLTSICAPAAQTLLLMDAILATTLCCCELKSGDSDNTLRSAFTIGQKSVSNCCGVGIDWLTPVDAQATIPQAHIADKSIFCIFGSYLLINTSTAKSISAALAPVEISHYIEVGLYDRHDDKLRKTFHGIHREGVFPSVPRRNQ